VAIGRLKTEGDLKRFLERELGLQNVRTLIRQVQGGIVPSPPTGAAGGVLGGTYPDPGFAVDMATQAELDAEAAARAAADTAEAAARIAGDAANARNVFIQQTTPTSTDPFLWVELDSGGSVVSMWVGP
jgi:hypothetical protein